MTTDDLPAVEPHGGLVSVFDDLFLVTGSVVMAPLVRIPRNMVVVRTGRELTLINAVRLREDALGSLEALGTIAHVVKIGMHGMDDAFYVRRYGARQWGLPGMKHPHGGERTDELAPDHLPSPDLELFTFEHTKSPEAALLYRGNGGVLLTCDSVQNWVDTAGCSLPAKLITHLMGFMKPAQIGPPWRKAMTPEGGTLRPDFERMLALDFTHLVGAHGAVLRDEAKERLGQTLTRVFGA
jgi:hypothetical protein